ncbi:HDOD domain-containing protein [Deferrisoma camini]|uniref:HDOD domain-containing protein n=1 Tax=Deferrisoma camini TaxID=1035120 RepID=UPI00046D76AF|nr:HDOD domain-containing protein [Deferrisoma camini]
MTLDELVERAGGLVSLPEVCLRLNDVISDDRATAEDVAETLRADPALAARVLKLVNSAFYGLPRRVETVTHAVALLGREEVRALAVATAAAETFRNVPAADVSMDSFWRHSVYAAAVAATLAPGSRRTGRERLLLSGLLHDVGWLVLLHLEPERARAVLEADGEGWERLHQVEKEVLGFTHADVGARLLSDWGLPQSLWEPVAFHHEPHLAEAHAADAARVHIANAAASVRQPGILCVEPGEAFPVLPEAWAAAGLTHEELTALLPEAEDRFDETLEIVFSGYTTIY